MEKKGESDYEVAQKKGRRRLLLFPLPLQGHINPMLQLANILYSEGFSITIIHTNYNSPKSDNYPHFTFHPIPDGFSESELSGSEPGALHSLVNVKCIDPFRHALAQLLADASGDPIACLISDAMLHFTRGVADDFKLPRIVLRTSGVAAFLAFAACPPLLEKGFLPIQDSQLEMPVAELPPLRVKDLPVTKRSNTEAFYELLEGMVRATKASSGLIWNSFEELEQPALATLRQDFPVPSFPIGPFHKYFPASSSSLMTQDKDSVSWLDSQSPRSVLYVSFGSVAALDEDQFLEVAWGLANCKHPFLWVVRPGSVRGSTWLEPLPSGFLESLDGRGRIVKWAPQQEVLAHPAVGAFWTHGGWNSVLESICEGVPMICTPFFGDQMVDTRYVSHVWEVGLELDGKLDRERVEKAINTVMVENTGKEMRQRVLHLKEKVNQCLSPGGSSYESLKKLVSYISSF